MINKLILVICALLAAGLTYFGALECFEFTAPIWIIINWFGGAFTVITAIHLFDGK
ncbi:hypothetical protein UFOVP1025_24 [uncultured Caudovirales phage]|uniref:Uncharacterized protein n=1 Tax=uncultured Caudovirales phage TaxID=2100421 RepID=A0A6J5Q671_9CAUD|nr:hypothetical protein UFOVP852_10 [uncultured Caudovirales phage]CAB4173170.1 hypothetical protein UFOVP948_33 [uncultured Caudovirales phage]CAB4179012.1 hypothetical protein UFOVP1025_24 [uncultured Caudovirales phage]CAB4219917.1 hypothetical protein UFOVP1628_27 [uncultured Caudovirales phage]